MILATAIGCRRRWYTFCLGSSEVGAEYVAFAVVSRSAPDETPTRFQKNQNRSSVLVIQRIIGVPTVKRGVPPGVGSARLRFRVLVVREIRRPGRFRPMVALRLP